MPAGCEGGLILSAPRCKRHRLRWVQRLRAKGGRVMWGNRMGWVLAGVLLLMVGSVTYVLAASARLTPPTDFSQQGEVRAAIVLPVEPSSIYPSSRQGDAGTVYRALVEKYAPRLDELTGLVRQFDKPLPADAREMVQPLVEVMDLREARIFADAPALIVTYKATEPQLETLYTLGLMAARLGRDNAKSDPDASLRYAQAAFALGCKFYRERINYNQLDKGLSLMDAACQVMAIQIDPLRQERIWAFVTGLRNYRAKAQAIYQVIASPDEMLIAKHAGDIFSLAADNTIDPTWRVECILKVGRYRFQAYRAGDQRKAPTLLDQLSADSNLSIRAASMAAQRLTLGEFHLIGN